MDWYGYGKSSIFSIGYRDGDGDEYIPVISPSSFKLLNYSQSIK